MEVLAGRQPIYLTEVTPRDGEQMDIRNVTVPERLDALDALVATGIDRVELGHIDNPVDREFIQASLGHVTKKQETDERYANLSIQVLRGTLPGAEESFQIFNGFDKSRIVLHVYDRLSPNLRDLAEKPYSAMESARRVASTCQVALDMGFTRFSISGEGATDTTVDEALEYHGYVAEYLDVNGATEINTNIANTPGSPPEGEWDRDGLEYFNSHHRSRVPTVSISVHTHNDDGSANEFAVTAIKAGFDRVEGTVIGMGERVGNVALCDTMVRLLEIARLEIEATTRPVSNFRLGRIAARRALFATRSLPQEIVDNLGNWFDSSIRITQIYDTTERFENTSLGHPASYKAGSGPHDHASKRALENPKRWPLWKNYLRIALIHAMQGRPEAQGVIAADPVTIKAITINGHAAGGSTQKIVDGAVERTDTERAAIAMARKEIEAIYNHITD